MKKLITIALIMLLFLYVPLLLLVAPLGFVFGFLGGNPRKAEKFLLWFCGPVIYLYCKLEKL